MGLIASRVFLLSPALLLPGFWYVGEPAAFLSRVAACFGTLLLPKGIRGPALLWVIGIALATSLAEAPSVAFWSTHARSDGALQSLAYVAALGLLLRVPDTPKWTALAAALACVPGIVPIGWGLAGELGLPRLQGSTGNPLFLGSLLIFGMWGAYRWGKPVLAGLLFVALLLTGAKGAILGAVVGGLLLWRHGLLAVLLLTAGLAWVAPTESIRWSLWYAGIQGVIERPWGWGAEHFPLLWDRYSVPFSEPWQDRAHSMYIDRALDWGVLGLGGFLWLIALAWKRGERPERFALTAYLVQAIFTFDSLPTMVGLLAVIAYSLRKE